MNDQRPPVTWPELFLDDDLVEGPQPWPPRLVGKLPPWRFASIAARLTSRAMASSRCPPAASNGSSSGWSTSRANARARAWSSSWAGLSVRSTPGV